MRSISRTLRKYLKDSLKVTYPFEESVNVSLNITPDHDYSSDISIQIFNKHKSQLEKLWGPYNTPPTPQTFSDEIKINIPRKSILSSLDDDFDGKILMRIKKEILEDHLKNVIKNKAEYFDREENKSKKILILFPFGEILQKMFLNQFRGLNICESIARIHEYFGYKVIRISCLQNFSHFHGILLEYLLEKRFVDNLDVERNSISFANISKFLIEKNLSNATDIQEFGAQILNNINSQEKHLKLHKELSDISLNEMRTNFKSFLEMGSEIIMLQSDFVNKKMIKFLEECSRKGTAFYSSDMGFYNLQDENFYNNIAKLYNILFHPSQKTHFQFWGHNSLFVSLKSKTPIYMDNLLKQIISTSLDKATALFPTIPSNLNEIQQKSLQKMSLGWARFQDHEKNRLESYELDLKNTIDNIFNETDLVNIRLNITEFLDKEAKEKGSIDSEIENFTIHDFEDRIITLKLLQFIDIVDLCLENKNISELTLYIREISKMTNLILKGESKNKRVILQAALEIISKGFLLLGII